jgi:uncharacterized phage-associated protein
VFKVMPYPVRAVANYFLEQAEAEGKKLTPMQLQKLVYFAHGWYLALTGKPLVDEQVEAWPYGPVFPTLYHEFKEYGGGPIKGRATEWTLEVNPATGRQTIVRAVVPTLEDDPDTAQLDTTKSILNRVWNVYGSWNAVQLSQLTHVAGGPWDVTRRQHPDRKGTDIADPLIRDYFLKKAGQEA